MKESGMRLKVTCIINDSAEGEPVQTLAKQMSESFGGCTVIPRAAGYWVEDGELLSEMATIVEVSFPQANEYDIDYVTALMTAAQGKAGGTWTHIEVSEFEAFHTKVGHYSEGYVNWCERQR